LGDLATFFTAAAAFLAPLTAFRAALPDFARALRSALFAADTVRFAFRFTCRTRLLVTAIAASRV
jgi:hypothetical protein